MVNGLKVNYNILYMCFKFITFVYENTKRSL